MRTTQEKIQLTTEAIRVLRDVQSQLKNDFVIENAIMFLDETKRELQKEAGILPDYGVKYGHNRSIYVFKQPI